MCVGCCYIVCIIIVIIIMVIIVFLICCDCFNYDCHSWLLRAEMHLKAVKASNRAISHCPIINGTRGKGLVDILILISDSYSAMNK